MPTVLTEESPLAADLLDDDEFEIPEERAAFIARALEEADIEAASPDAERCFAEQNSVVENTDPFPPVDQWTPAAEVIQMMREKYCGSGSKTSVLDRELQRLSREGDLILAKSNVSTARLPDVYENIDWRKVLDEVREDLV
jgi:hypothetical protein